MKTKINTHARAHTQSTFDFPKTRNENFFIYERKQIINGFFHFTRNGFAADLISKYSEFLYTHAVILWYDTNIDY